MTDRIASYAKSVMEGKCYYDPKPVKYDREDMFLPEIAMSAKRVSEYILAQDPIIEDGCRMTGRLYFDGSVEGDIFTRVGHKRYIEMIQLFYFEPLHNLATFEFQHSAANFERVLKEGIGGTIGRIRESRKAHNEKAELEFLDGLESVCNAITGWAEKCSKAAAAAHSCELAEALLRVPKGPAQSFYEAMLSISVCYSFISDTIGCIDKYLYPYYRKDVDSGKITAGEAKELFQEFFLRMQARYKPDFYDFYRGAGCHFCVGGYNPDGEDGFNELSRLIVESLMELPTYIPQISLRWTRKTPTEALAFMLDCERKDKNKRIAFVSDEPRIKALTGICGFDYETAANYTMCGCNELALPGGIFIHSAQFNIVRSLTNTLYLHRGEALRCADFDSFYALYERELFKDLDEQRDIDYKFNHERAKDVNLVSSIFYDGCVENAKSVTQGGSVNTFNTLAEIGIVNVIDSLSIIKQFVYEEKRVTMAGLLDALESDWAGGGHADLRMQILNKGRFFGNNDPLSDGIAKRFFESLYEYIKDKKDQFGYQYLYGNMMGYRGNLKSNHQAFGELTKATPDGRHDGDVFTNGIQQNLGKDREGLTPMLASIAQADEHGIFSGDNATTIMLDEKLINDDEYFPKTVKILETYFMLGGSQLQLNYVSAEDLAKAKLAPREYKSLRVRVTGYSDYFVNLDDALQDEIIERTRHSA